ncbi:hypothetical protein HZH68_011492 [Vespula germanica]|uniref:Uncharacterized protein n=1 Tax=Vespula germanica TaxID=30212 RepID=A0A834JS44_VESGE|nr:hypothetical protein HZH68_011492 [Vespula germanica]
MRITWQLPVHADRITRDEIPSDRNWSPFSGCCSSINDTATIIHRRKDDSETCRGTKRFISIKSNANESLSHLGIEFSSCTCSSLETSCRGMRIFRKVRFSKQRTGFFVKASFKKLFIAPFTENQGSSNHFVASSKFSLVIHKDQNATSCNANMQTPNYTTDIQE